MHRHDHLNYYFPPVLACISNSFSSTKTNAQFEKGGITIGFKSVVRLQYHYNRGELSAAHLPHGSRPNNASVLSPENW